jgi:hypothetical protein
MRELQSLPHLYVSNNDDFVIKLYLLIFIHQNSRQVKLTLFPFDYNGKA